MTLAKHTGFIHLKGGGLLKGGGVKHYNAVYLFNIPMNY